MAWKLCHLYHLTKAWWHRKTPYKSMLYHLCHLYHLQILIRVMFFSPSPRLAY